MSLYATRAHADKVGSCNFCSSRHWLVWVVHNTDGGLEVRLCDFCLRQLKIQTK